jgi:hypothetical protein
MNKNEPTINKDNLYLEETFTDLENGAIKRFTPLGEHSQDKVKYVAMATIMTPRGPMPINAPMADDVNSLNEACEKFRETVDAYIKELVKQAQEMEREQRSRIITPADVAGNSGLSLIK